MVISRCRRLWRWQNIANRAGRLKDNAQRVFIEDMVLMTRRGMRLSPGRLGYLASIYIQIGGTV